MKLSHLLIVSILFSFLSVITVQAAPALITYAGKVSKNGAPYSGNGQFKFAFVNAAANVTYWSHDGTSTYGAAPTGHITLPVNGGYYSILLGNTAISGMSAIDPAIFSTHSDVHLRVWFSDGVAAFEELAPHRPFASVPYALNAGISAGSITKSMLSVDIQADLNRTITKTMLSQQILEDLNRTVDKSMLAQEVLADLNASGSGATPGGIIAVPYGQNAPAGYSPYTLGDRKGFAWTEKTAVTQARYAYDAVVALSNEIYFVGGSTSAGFRGVSGMGSNVTTVEKYNLGTNSWQAVASLPAGRFRYATAALNGKIHVMGGHGLNTSVVYDPSTNQWTAGPNLPSVVENGGAVSFNGKIYLIGGEGAAGNQVLEFDPSTNQWSAKAPMPTARSGVELVVFENRIWAIGSDQTQSNAAESFDPVGNTWRAETSLPNSADIAWVANGTIYCGVYGGEIFVFDSTNSLWRQSGVMPGYFDAYGYAISAAVVTGSRVHLVGGPSNGQAGFGPVNSNKHYVADLNSSVLGVRDLYVLDGNASTGPGSGGSTPAPGSITKSMLSSQVLADLNSSTPGPGSITQQMLASEVQAMLSGQSSSIFAPTLANPYGYAGGTPIESNASSYTVPSDKVLVILARAGHSILIPYSGMRFGDYSSIRNPFLVPPGTSFKLQNDDIGWEDVDGFAGILFDPVAHITPVLVSSGYQVPVGKVLVFAGKWNFSGYSRNVPTIHLAGSLVFGNGTGYLVDASMLVNSGGSGGGGGSSNAVNLSSDLNVTNETHIFADKDLNRTVVVRLPKAGDHNLKSVRIVPNPGQVIRVEGDDGELYGADWANLSQPIELISNQGRWNPLGYQLQLAIRGMVFDVWSGSQNGQPQNFTDVNGTIYFVADNGVDGIELWKTDGTAAGTSQVKDFNSGSGHGLGSYDYMSATSIILGNTLKRLGNSLLFKANDGVTGDGLWKTDGTESGTVLVKNSGFSSLYLSESIVFQGNLLFTANDGSWGLWKTDGTESGTVKLASFSGGYRASDFIVFNNEVFFKGGQSSYGYELWKTDGTTSGTVMVKDIRGGSSGGLGWYTGFTELAGSLYFAATDGSNNNELWKTDGTTGGTMMVKDIRSAGSSNPQNFITYSNSIFFSADDGINGSALWKTDGTSGGTVMVKNMLGFTNSVVCGGNLFFTTDDGVHGNELWKTDGTSSGTVLVKDIYPGSNGSGPSYLVAIGSNLLFAAADGENGMELWTSDGTADGTTLFRDIRPGPSHSSPQHLQNIGGDLYLSAEDVNGRELWKFDASEF